jgi:FAD/FMN-containing dehydrogenase
METQAAVVGFDPQARTWVTAVAAGSLQEVPPLDGTLSVDVAARADAALDQGNMVSVIPSAVLRPASAEDVARMVQFCRRHGIQLAAQGQSHTTFGQSLVDGGLIVDTSSLHTIHSVGPREADGADVGSGVLWSDLLPTAVAAGLTPPVLTAYTALSVGGTLSFGGISPTNAAGAQIDHVRELEVVTGEGRVVWCSMEQERELFEAVLGGIGQFGIITRVRMALVPAPSRVRSWCLHYADNATFFRDLRMLVDRGELRDCYCELHLGGESLLYRLVAGVGYEPGQPPDDAHLLRGLSLPPSAAIPADQPYLDWVLRVDAGTAELQRMVGWDRLVKPWFDMWLADSAVEDYVGRVVPALRPPDIGFGLGFVYAQRRSRLKRPFLVLPEPDGSDVVFMFGVLTTSTTPGPDPAFARRMLDRNRRLYDLAVEAGGTRYAVGSIETTGRDWKQQYGPLWDELCRRKLRFDPDGILTPGPGIFS